MVDAWTQTSDKEPDKKDSKENKAFPKSESL